MVITLACRARVPRSIRGWVVSEYGVNGNIEDFQSFVVGSNPATRISQGASGTASGVVIWDYSTEYSLGI